MKMLKWSFGDRYTEGYLESKDIIIGNKIMLSKGLYEGLQFGINGLGLRKFEREIFESKFLHVNNVVNIYIGKLIISYDRRGYKEHLSHCNIDWEMKLSNYIKHIYNYSFKPTMERKINTIISKILKKILFRKKEVFTVCQSWEEPKIVKCDKLTAYQLASNYEADLMQDNRYLLSPLGFEWEENKNLIIKHLGKIFNNYKLYGYSNWNDVEIL
ncbi:hypothetical protein [uncultured Clostridium sp.]|uniref:hypothetical protein n=1 Tax=uncultured Clostridium sp. TaxID=59620 RepID=UPI0032177328